jgi:Ribbon-helix-helix protein, copG family
MKANHYSGVAVRLPTELRDILENMAAERGESLSLIIRDLLRRGTAKARRVDQTEIMAGGSDIVADFIESGRRGSTGGSPVSAK